MKLTTLNPDIIGMHLDKIELRPHNPEWLKIGEELSSEFSKLLKNHKHFIEHVGSTSIPTIKAKPIIDLAIVSDYEDDCNEKIFSTYENFIKGEEWLTQFYDDATNKTFCNLHIFNFKEKEWRHFFSVKRFFIDNPREAKRYEELKQYAMMCHPNSYDNYCYKKSGLLGMIAREANDKYRTELNNMVYRTFN